MPNDAIDLCTTLKIFIASHNSDEETATSALDQCFQNLYLDDDTSYSAEVKDASRDPDNAGNILRDRGILDS